MLDFLLEEINTEHMETSLDWLTDTMESATVAEPGALFIRTGSKKAETLTRHQADAVEGLLMLMNSDDWKGRFIVNILLSFRKGQREAPRDVQWSLNEAVSEFEIEVENARNIARDYSPLLETTYLVVGKGGEKAAVAQCGGRK